MKIFDISWPIAEDMTAYKDRHVVSITPTKVFQRDGVREHLVTLGTHTGTHVDAPAHFLEHGATIDSCGLEQLLGLAVVVDLTHVVGAITVTDLEREAIFTKIQSPIVLLKTANSGRAINEVFDPLFVWLSTDAAAYLVEHGVRAVGIDYLGIERGQVHHETHTVLLQHKVPIIEGLRLGHVPVGIYECICLPLLMPGLEAAPARAILRTL